MEAAQAVAVDADLGYHAAGSIVRSPFYLSVLFLRI
jgi:hypothetical protein